ncbi:MAG: GHMP kinase [Thermoplasmata archaeon]|nr:GHMP kinase [Thermoplasmata archaeon]
MVMSRTPLRVSFAGGGTDLAAYYKEHGGAVTSTAINKHIYVVVNERFDDSIRVSYSKTEIVDSVDAIQHELVREAMKKTGVISGVEITTIADIPSRGTGLGSSSTLTVGLLNALYAFHGEPRSRERLAREACEIEIDLLGAPIGKQDQYIAAHGGLQHIRFNRDESVFVDPIICDSETKKALSQNLLMFYTGITRKSHEVLTEQKENTSRKKENLDALKELASVARDELNHNNPVVLGEVLRKGWDLKKQLASGISNPDIDAMYTKARDAGAAGGKILGAGGGGFLLVYADPEHHWPVRQALKDHRELVFALDSQGTKIIYVEE